MNKEGLYAMAEKIRKVLEESVGGYVDVFCGYGAGKLLQGAA